MSGYFSEAASKVGAKERQGAHHEAQKSTITMSFPEMVSLKLSAVRVMVAMQRSVVA
jgi:hypothetical protein